MTKLRFQYGAPALAVHPHDDGVWLAGATALDELPHDTDAVASLCLTGHRQVPKHVEHVTFRLMDEPDLAFNPNLDFVLVDAARTVASLRDGANASYCTALPPTHARRP